MFHSFAVNPANLSTPTVLNTTARRFNNASIQAQGVNTAPVRIVARQADGTFPTTGGVVLSPGSGGNPGTTLSELFAGAPLPHDFNQLALIITHTGDGVDILYAS